MLKILRGAALWQQVGRYHFTKHIRLRLRTLEQTASKIESSEEFDRQFKHLLKKHKSLITDLLHLKQDLIENPFQGDAYYVHLSYTLSKKTDNPSSNHVAQGSLNTHFSSNQKWSIVPAKRLCGWSSRI